MSLKPIGNHSIWTKSFVAHLSFIASLLFLISLFAGCASVSDVPLPKVTRFDGNRKLRAIYLEYYRMGYKEPFSSGPCIFTYDSESKARMFGYADGQMTAIADHQLLEEKEREAKERAKSESRYK